MRPAVSLHVALVDDHVARKHNAVLPVLQLDPVGRIVDRLVRIEPGDGLRIGDTDRMPARWPGCRPPAPPASPRRARRESGRAACHRASSLAVGGPCGESAPSLRHLHAAGHHSQAGHCRPAPRCARRDRRGSSRAEKVPAGTAPSTPPLPTSVLFLRSIATPRAVMPIAVGRVEADHAVDRDSLGVEIVAAALGGQDAGPSGSNIRATRSRMRTIGSFALFCTASPAASENGRPFESSPR